MKKYIALYAIVAAALVAAPAIVRAEDKPNKSEATETNKPAKKHGAPFHGKVAAVDATAMTVTVGTMTIGVNSDTKIIKDGKPATFSDIAVGEKISGAYKKDEAGKMTASVIHIGEGKAKGEGKKKAEKN
jgi:hypothetical protein